jgi:hypothetical protein
MVREIQGIYQMIDTVFNVDSYPAFYPSEDPETGRQNNADPCRFGFWSDFKAKKKKVEVLHEKYT